MAVPAARVDVCEGGMGRKGGRRGGEEGGGGGRGGDLIKCSWLERCRQRLGLWTYS